MSITVVGIDGNPFDYNSVFAGGDRFISTVVTLKFSGNYPTGGDALDLTNGGGTPLTPTTIPPGTSRGAARIAIDWSGTTGSWSAGGGYYTIIAPKTDRPLTFVDIANLQVAIYNGGGVQLSANPYPNTVLTDVVTVEVIYAR